MKWRDGGEQRKGQGEIREGKKVEDEKEIEQLGLEKEMKKEKGILGRGQ